MRYVAHTPTLLLLGRGVALIRWKSVDIEALLVRIYLFLIDSHCHK